MGNTISVPDVVLLLICVVIIGSILYVLASKDFEMEKRPVARINR